MSYDRVLLTTDGSEASMAAVDEALKISESCGAEIHVLYVVDTGVDSSYDSVDKLMSETETSRKLKEVGEKAVQSIVERLEKSNVEFKTSIQEGKPFKQINSYADREQMDIIVMSTHGRTGLDRLLIGSVTEKVVRSSEKPVLTVKNK